MDCADEDVNLSIQIENQIKCGKVGSVTRNLIGMKYVTEYLKEKYNTDITDVYLQEH